jgi:hypothetical protein
MARSILLNKDEEYEKELRIMDLCSADAGCRHEQLQ